MIECDGSFHQKIIPMIKKGWFNLGNRFPHFECKSKAYINQLVQTKRKKVQRRQIWIYILIMKQNRKEP
ncbi:unnamed protein product (macronuclear) [Paramecium tetraurelia]|uniref:Uncharacterized protein n=1 Tax=Paramecium tetraurelia TaxID=5888 RepID=A0DCY1_PARTE|nr:uncharacterized protein GSPATT00015757001 [Paramecium tetraurelia]CAK80898.1 unnamed protein product [Paramecium tetraurelia]|eukprot:XP_001448295.1 hypothetical protein (macronuclear) [Paramecium tetraurelia strain d4-2]